MNALKIIQWNARSLKNKWNELINFLCCNSVLIAIIQGLWLNTNDKIYYVYRQDCKDGYGGIAFIIRKSITCEITKERNRESLQLLAIKIKSTNANKELIS